MAVLLGKDLMIYVYGDGDIGDTDQLYPIACDKDCTLTIGMGLLETTSKDNGPWYQCLPTIGNIKINGDGLVDFSKVMGLQSLQSKIISRQLIVFKVTAELGLNERIIYSGQGYLDSVGITGTAGQAATFSYELIGTGVPDIDNNIPVDGDGGTPADDMAQVLPLYFRTTLNQTSYQDAALVGAKLLFLSIEQVIIFKDDGLGPAGETHWTGFDAATGTVTWNFATQNLSRGYIEYKK